MLLNATEASHQSSFLGHQEKINRSICAFTVHHSVIFSVRVKLEFLCHLLHSNLLQERSWYPTESSNFTMKKSASGLDGLTWTCWHHLTVECWSVTPGHTWQQREEECFHRYQHSRSLHLYTMEETTLQVHVVEDTVGNGGVWSIYIPFCIKIWDPVNRPCMAATCKGLFPSLFC